jgi:Flp pilus assembly protein TadB
VLRLASFSVNWVTITPDLGSILIAHALRETVTKPRVTCTASEVDMQQTTISGRRGSRYPVGEAVWIVAGIIVMLAFGDAFILSALAFAIVTMTAAWWAHRKAEHRVERIATELAPVTHLRPSLTGQRELKNTQAHSLSHGPNAA